MMNLKVRAESLGKTEEEIREEMAAALGRIGRTLERLIGRLHDLCQEFAANPDRLSPDKIDLYNQIHREARLYYWYLTVQRESIGLTNHELLPKLYPIPPALGS
jgi:hypothetical protein